MATGSDPLTSYTANRCAHGPDGSLYQVQSAENVPQSISPSKSTSQSCIGAGPPEPYDESHMQPLSHVKPMKGKPPALHFAAQAALPSTVPIGLLHCAGTAAVSPTSATASTYVQPVGADVGPSHAVRAGTLYAHPTVASHSDAALNSDTSAQACAIIALLAGHESHGSQPHGPSPSPSQMTPPQTLDISSTQVPTSTAPVTSTRHRSQPKNSLLMSGSAGRNVIAWKSPNISSGS